MLHKHSYLFCMYTPIHNHYLYTHAWAWNHFGMLEPSPSMGSFSDQAIPHLSFDVEQPVRQHRAACTRHWRCRLVYRWQGKRKFWGIAIFLSQKRVGGWNQLFNKNTSQCIWQTSKLLKKWTVIIPRNIFPTYSQKNQSVIHENLLEHIIQRTVRSQKNPCDFGSAFQIIDRTSNKYMK